MQADNNLLHDYVQSLNAWHLELATLASALKCFSYSNQVDCLENSYADLVHIFQQRFDELVESCPFPAVNEVVKPEEKSHE